jgi:hypothetical protein
MVLERERVHARECSEVLARRERVVDAPADLK